MDVYQTTDEIIHQYYKAREKHAKMRSPHEGYAIILEELDELWEEVKAWQPNDGSSEYVLNMDRMRKEAFHVASMALAFLMEVTP